jgi:hypothetical protein
MCRKEINFADQAMKYPIVRIRIIERYVAHNEEESKAVDLCSECMKKVYDYIYNHCGAEMIDEQAYRKMRDRGLC